VSPGKRAVRPPTCENGHCSGIEPLRRFVSRFQAGRALVSQESLYRSGYSQPSQGWRSSYLSP